MTARWLFRVALLIGLGAAAANADEPTTRIFHIGIVAGLPRSSPEHAAFEERLRELGYVEGRNLTIDFVRDYDLDGVEREAVGSADPDRPPHHADHSPL